MSTSSGTEYYSSSEFRKKIKDSITKNGKELESELKVKNKYISNDEKEYA